MIYLHTYQIYDGYYYHDFVENGIYYSISKYDYLQIVEYFTIDEYDNISATKPFESILPEDLTILEFTNNRWQNCEKSKLRIALNSLE